MQMLHEDQSFAAQQPAAWPLSSSKLQAVSSWQVWKHGCWPWERMFLPT